MSEQKKRRKWSASEKLRIVLLGLETGVEVSDLCRREGINPTMYYGWKRQLVQSATKIFDGQGKKPASELDKVAGELARMKEVVAEITAENLTLKKTLSG